MRLELMGGAYPREGWGYANVAAALCICGTAELRAGLMLGGGVMQMGGRAGGGMRGHGGSGTELCGTT